MAANFDWYVSATVSPEAANKRTATFRLFVSSASTAKRAGFRAWLTDSVHGGITGTAPSTVSTSPTTALVRVREVVTKKAWIFLLNSTGHMDLTIGHGAAKTWYLQAAMAEGIIKTQSVAFT